MLYTTDGMPLQRVISSAGLNIPKNAVVGGYSPDGKPLYAVLAKHEDNTDMYIAGNYEEGNDNAEYAMKNNPERAEGWKYLVANGNEPGWSATVFSLKNVDKVPQRKRTLNVWDESL